MTKTYPVISPKLDWGKLKLLGNEFCLDFVNTIWDPRKIPAEDYLRTFTDFLHWLRQAKGVPRSTVRDLNRWSSNNPKAAKRILLHIHMYRDELRQVFSAIAHQRRIPDRSLSFVNRKISEFLKNLEFRQVGGKVISIQRQPESLLDRALEPITRSAFRLLRNGDHGRVHECPRCSWVFYDTSKGGRRKWCSMDFCGSPTKSLSYYYRQKGEEAS